MCDIERRYAEFALQKAAELIKDLSIYTFKYKENNEPSIGIMAQDLLEETNSQN